MQSKKYLTECILLLTILSYHFVYVCCKKRQINNFAVALYEVSCERLYLFSFEMAQSY